MASALEFSSQERLDHFYGLRDRRETRRNRDDVGIVVLSGKRRDFFGPTQSRANTRMFVDRNRDAVAWTADHDTEIGVFVGNIDGDRVSEIGVIDRIGRVCAVVGDFMAELAQFVDNRFFVIGAGVVVSYRDFHTIELCVALQIYAKRKRFENLVGTDSGIFIRWLKFYHKDLAKVKKSGVAIFAV